MQAIYIDTQSKLTSSKDLESCIPSSEQLELYARSAFNEAGYTKDCEFSVNFVESSEIQELNSTYRHKDYPTNILTFPFEVPEDLPEEARDEVEYLGDLVISLEVMQKEALEQNKSLTEHCAHLIVHGCLHLLGFDHIEDDEAEEMESLEIKILAKLGYRNPYLDE